MRNSRPPPPPPHTHARAHTDTALTLHARVRTGTHATKACMGFIMLWIAGVASRRLNCIRGARSHPLQLVHVAATT
jgi:hypothetical protein